MNKITGHKVVAVVIMLMLFLPVIQEVTRFFQLKPLEGEYKNPIKPTFNWGNWLNSTYTDSMEKYVQLHFGYSSLLTRIHNQYLFSVFNSSRNSSTVIGKKNEIFDYAHIQAYLGTDFVGESIVEEKLDRLEKINQVLKLFNTEIIIVIAPSKPSFVPEYLPDKYKKTNQRTNYDHYIDCLDKTNLGYVDFSKVFKEWKHNERFPLFPQCGVHWSEYGATLAADSMIKYIHDYFDISGPEMMIDTVITSSSLSKSDYDMGSTLNLLYPIKPYPMGYPKISVDKNVSRSQRLLTVGDSYYWIWYNIVGYDTKFFESSVFFEYFSKAHSIEWGAKSINSIDVLEESVNTDVIMIVCSESNLYRLGYGYIEKMYTSIPQLHRLYEYKVNDYKSKIKNDNTWYEQIKSKSAQKQISVDSMLTLDAIYLIQHEKH